MNNKRLNGLFVSIILFLSLTACSGSNSSSNPGGEANSPEITMEELSKITKGMELQEVIDVVGGEGKQMGQSGESDTKAHKVSYVWDGTAPNSFVHISFQNNKVMTIKDVNVK